MIDAAQLNLRHLRAFAAICRLGSITRAADVVHLSQPAITQGLARLETAVGAPLFLRHGRGLSPTEEGRILSFRTDRAFDMLEALIQGKPLENRHIALEAHLTIRETCAKASRSTAAA